MVIHCTELPDLAAARDYGERIHYEESRTGNSGHFYIDRDGATQCWVPVERIAHHVRAYNERSIGIELVNTGRWPDWFASTGRIMTESYPETQLESLRWIAGHEDLDRAMTTASDDPKQLVRRKSDPGPMFPWPDILESTTLRRFYPDRSS